MCELNADTALLLFRWLGVGLFLGLLPSKVFNLSARFGFIFSAVAVLLFLRAEDVCYLPSSLLTGLPKDVLLLEFFNGVLIAVSLSLAGYGAQLVASYVAEFMAHRFYARKGDLWAQNSCSHHDTKLSIEPVLLLLFVCLLLAPSGASLSPVAEVIQTVEARAPGSFGMEQLAALGNACFKLTAKLIFPLFVLSLLIVVGISFGGRSLRFVTGSLLASSLFVPLSLLILSLGLYFMLAEWQQALVASFG